MVKIEINEKIVDIILNGNTILLNGETISEELFNEFEEQILCKKVSECTNEEFIKKIEEMAKSLNTWVKHKDAWLSWKKWAENL
jgi:ATP phosphoribosyltransferase